MTRMEKKLSWWWEFTVAGLIVAVISLAGVDWYTHGKIEQKDAYITALFKDNQKKDRRIYELVKEDDSLYKVNDSLMWAAKGCFTQFEKGIFYHYFLPDSQYIGHQAHCCEGY
jgi:hypothetical protein